MTNDKKPAPLGLIRGGRIITPERLRARMKKLSAEILSLPLAEQVRLAADFLDDGRDPESQRKFARQILEHVLRALHENDGPAPGDTEGRDG